MLKALRPIAQVLLAVVFLELALGAMSPLVGLQLVRQAVPTAVIGLIQSAYFAGFLVGTLSCHRAIDRVGHIRAFAVFAALAANATLLHAVVRDPAAWFAFRAAVGYGMAGLFVIAESWLNDKATSATRGRVFALYTTVSWAAGGIGPLGLNLPDPEGNTLFAIVTMLMATALVPMALTKVGHPEIGHRNHFGIVRLYRISPLGVFACFGSGLINTALYGLLPVYTESTGYSAGQLSLLLTLGTMGALVFQFPVGSLADRFGRRPLMLASALLGAGATAAVAALDGPAFPWLLALFAATASMTAPLYALGVGQANDYVSKKDFVAASAGLLFAWGLGASIGPTAAAAVMQQFGPAGLFLFLTGALLLIAGFVLVRMALRRALTPVQQGNFVPVPLSQGTYGAPELDPRGEPETHPPAGPPEE